MTMQRSNPRSLYIAYFGVREPLVQTQVIPYLRELVKGGTEVALLTFEPEEDGKGRKGDSEILAELKAEDIDWHWLRYHKRPSVPATLFDIVNGARFIRKLMNQKPFDILHARSHVPMVMAAAARRVSPNKPKLLFDIRGFMPEEYADAGVWPEKGSIYRAVKRVENRLMRAADGFVVLTEKARDVLFPESGETGFDSKNRPVEVIPCCVDFERRFSGEREAGRSAIRKKLNIEGRFVLTHLGALGGLYLTDRIVDFLAVVRDRDPRTFAMFLTQSDPEIVLPLLKKRGFSEDDFFIDRVPPSNVADYLYASDVGLSFVLSSYATQSRSPTKIPEYLACGLPIIANPGVGDVDAITREDNTGVILQDLSPDSYTKAFDELRKLMSEGEALRKRCIESAHRRFDLETVGGERYKRLYSRIANGPGR